MAKCQSGAAFVVSSVSAVSLVLCGDAYALRMEEASTAANRGQGGAASGTEHASTHRGFVAGVVGDGGQVRSGRREVVIMDHGTGVAAPVAAMVLLEEAEVELLAPADDPSTEVLDPLRIELLPTDRDDKVTLVDETRDPESRRLVLEHDWVADRLLKRFTHDRLAPTMPRPLVHGGAVSTPDGETALVLGPSGTGKSTLVAHLAQAGCELINDEQVSVHVEAGLLGGFTRPIDIKPGGIQHLPRVEGLTPIRSGSDAMVTARQLGTRHRLTGTPVLMVLPERDDRGEGCECTTVHPAEALEVLCANNLDLAREPLVALEAFAWLAATFPMWVLRYSRAAVAADSRRARSQYHLARVLVVEEHSQARL